MLNGTDDTRIELDQQRTRSTSMAATRGDASFTHIVHIPNYATRSPCPRARDKLAAFVASQLPGVALDDSWLVYPTVYLGYSTNSGPAKVQIAIVQPSLKPPGYFRTINSVVIFLQQLQQQNAPLPGVQGMEFSATCSAAVAAALECVGKAFKKAGVVQVPAAQGSTPSQQGTTAVSRKKPATASDQNHQQSAADSTPAAIAAGAAAENNSKPSRKQPAVAADAAAVAGVPAACKRSRPAGKLTHQNDEIQQQQQPSDNSANLAAAGPPLAAAAAAAAGQVPVAPASRKRKLSKTSQQEQQQRLLVEPSDGDSSDSGAAAVASSPVTQPPPAAAVAAPATAEPASPTPAAAAKKRSLKLSSQSDQQRATAAAAAAAQQPAKKQKLNSLKSAATQQAPKQPKQKLQKPASAAAAAAGSSKSAASSSTSAAVKEQQQRALDSKTWKVPVLPHDRKNDPDALAILEEQVTAAFPGWQLDKYWVMSPGNSSPAKPRIDPCIMHPSVIFGHLRSNRAVITYLTVLRTELAKLGDNIQVPGLVPVASSSSRQQQQQKFDDPEAVAGAIFKAARDIGRGFVGTRHNSSGTTIIKRPKKKPTKTSAAAPPPPPTAAVNAGQQQHRQPQQQRQFQLGDPLPDGRVPCAETLKTLQAKVTAAVPGAVLDKHWVAYPGGTFSGSKLDVCVMHPTTPFGYFRSMRAVITYVTELTKEIKKLGKNVKAPGLVASPAAAAGGGKSQQQQQQGSKKASSSDDRMAAAIKQAIAATGRTFVPRSRTMNIFVNRVLKTTGGGSSSGSSAVPQRRESIRAIVQQEERILAAAAAAKAAASGSKTKGTASSSQPSKPSAAVAKGKAVKGSSSSKKVKKALGPKPIISKTVKSKKTTAAAALVAKAKSRKAPTTAATKKSAAAAAVVTKPKALISKTKCQLAIQPKPHSQPRFSWKHPPVDREFDAPPKGPVLVLGMHFASKAAAKECHAGMAQHRDRARLLQLQQGLGYSPYSFDRDNTEAEAEGGLHIQGNFNSTRGARDVTLRFPGVRFGAVFLDYFRMPTGYALEVYKQQLFTQFVPELIRLGAAARGVPVYVPNNEVLLSKLAKEGAFQGYADFVAMPGDCYPLYQATDLATAGRHLQGAYSNASEVRQLCEGSEFVAMHCKMTAPANGN